ncbi:dockerin type I domain-containing protein [Salinirubellus sp. GCM10025818]|uniref:dockerin type I domain-containing protein n=1 Tax=Salinirubellus TaxID=2162630 RepID=UPI0030D3AB52
MTPGGNIGPVGRRQILRTLGKAGAGVGIANTGAADRAGDGEAVSGLFRALGIGSTDERGVDEEAIDQHGARNAEGRRDLGIQQQSGWNRFFNHGLEDLIPDTEANGGGCLIELGDNKSVKRFDAEGKKGWETSYETYIDDLIPVSEANGGGYLVAIDGELLRLGRDGSPQWRQNYDEDGVGRYISAITEAGSNGFLVGGGTSIDDIGVSWVAKLSEDGAVTWELRKGLHGSPGVYGEGVYDVHRATDGGYLIETERRHTIVLAKIDETGALVWSHQFGGEEIFVMDDDSSFAEKDYTGRLVRVTAEGTITWQKLFVPDQILEGEDGYLFARWLGWKNIVELFRPHGGRQWWREYDQRYTAVEADPDGYVLFGDDTVRKISGAGANEWERPLYLPTDIEYLSHLDDGGYLLGGIDESRDQTWSWIAMRGNLAGGLAVLPDVDGDGNPSRNPGGGRRFEDVNGDGSTDVGDAQALYENRNSPGIQINRELYDFNNDGEVNVGDAQALFAEVTEED